MSNDVVLIDWIMRSKTRWNEEHLASVIKRLDACGVADWSGSCTYVPHSVPRGIALARRKPLGIVSAPILVRATEHIISCEQIVGPVNVLAPEPVSNREFAKVLGKILHRPVFLKIPAFMLRLAMGEIAEAILAGDTHLKPEKLLATGFRFEFPDIESAIRHELSQ